MNNWKSLYKLDQIRVYLLEQNDKEVIDKEFDKLY